MGDNKLYISWLLGLLSGALGTWAVVLFMLASVGCPEHRPSPGPIPLALGCAAIAIFLTALAVTQDVNRPSESRTEGD